MITEDSTTLGYMGVCTLKRVREGRCACCGGETEDFRYIAEGVKQCNESCRSHGDQGTVEVILYELSLDLKTEQWTGWTDAS